MISSKIFLYSVVFGALALRAEAELISVRGTAVTGIPLATVAEDIRKESGVEYRVNADGGSAAGVAGVGQDVVDIGLTTRPVTGEEKAAFPEKRLVETRIGAQAVLVVVPEEIWQAGVRRLSKKQMIAIYERRVKNWKELGGENREIVFFNRPSMTTGKGIWDLFVIWLYDDVRKAPLSKADVLETPEEVRDTVEFNGGSISLLEFSEMPKAGLRAIPLELDNGIVVEPTAENIASGKYPISRPLILITSGRPTGAVKTVVDYMLGEKGQAAVEKAGHVSLKKLEAK